MRSWTPRRPSEGIKRRLFGAKPEKTEVARITGWLVPAAACMLLALAVLRQEAGGSAPGRDSAVAMILSNHSPIVYLPEGTAPAGHNVMLPATFEWTNGRSYTPTLGFMPVTNSTD